jgi:hypothetical protein
MKNVKKFGELKLRLKFTLLITKNGSKKKIQVKNNNSKRRQKNQGKIIYEQDLDGEDDLER